MRSVVTLFGMFAQMAINSFIAHGSMPVRVVLVCFIRSFKIKKLQTKPHQSFEITELLLNVNSSTFRIFVTTTVSSPTRLHKTYSFSRAQSTRFYIIIQSYLSSISNAITEYQTVVTIDKITHNIQRCFLEDFSLVSFRTKDM